MGSDLLSTAKSLRPKAGRLVAGLLLAGALISGGEAAPGSIPDEVWMAAGVAPAARSVEAPDFALRDLAGRSVSLASFRGRVVLLYFWATW